MASANPLNVTLLVIKILIIMNVLIKLGCAAQQESMQMPKNLRNAEASECVLLIRSDYYGLGVDHDDAFDCIFDSVDADGVEGMIMPIYLSKEQEDILQGKLKSGEIISNLSTLVFKDGFQISDEGLHIPFKEKYFEIRTRNVADRRSLARVTGDKPILVVKVTDVNGLSVNDSAQKVSDNVFGTNNDPVNLLSQMSACSFGKLKITPGESSSTTASGVVEVTIPISSTSTNLDGIRNEMIKATQASLGTTLPGPYHHIMFITDGSSSK